MPCQNSVIHILEPDDSLYKLSRIYQTTVQSILHENPGISPYNLRIGHSLTICPGPGYVPFGGDPNTNPARQTGEMDPNSARKPYVMLSNEMRRLWQEHMLWTRMLILTMVDGLGGEDVATKRLLQNPGDLGRLFGRYFGEQTGNKIENLVADHLKIGKSLIQASIDKNTATAADLDRRWYENADAMANAFAMSSPYYDRQTLQKMLYHHLGLTKQEVELRLAKNYQSDADNYQAIEQQAYNMADYFTQGIAQQSHD